MTDSSSTALSTSSVAAVSLMFKTADPTPKEELAQGACELPCTPQGDNPNIVKKKKDANCGGLTHKYELNSFQVTGLVKRKRMIPHPRQEVRRML